jgi:hypothetical protein
MSSKSSSRPQLGVSNTNFPTNIGQPALRALNNAGFSRLEQMTTITEKDLGKLHGMGPKALGLLREALCAKGLHLKD